jgi:hypothetical protein
MGKTADQLEQETGISAYAIRKRAQREGWTKADAKIIRANLQMPTIAPGPPTTSPNTPNPQTIATQHQNAPQTTTEAANLSHVVSNTLLQCKYAYSSALAIAGQDLAETASKRVLEAQTLADKAFVFEQIEPAARVLRPIMLPDSDKAQVAVQVNLLSGSAVDFVDV